MTNDEKAKAYEMALEAARKELGVDRKEWEVVQRVLHNIFPELRESESEDERIRKWIIEELEITRDAMSGKNPYSDDPDIVARLKRLDEAIYYLEKQKEPHFTKRNALFDECVAKCDPAIMKKVSDKVDEMLGKEQKPSCWNSPVMTHEMIMEKQKEQKPNSSEDMPYIADENFYERAPADSFKYKLAEYMTKCCTKKEGPYGYTYAISAETILKMAEEELLKRGVVQKPAEWSEEDKKILDDVSHILIGLNYIQIAKDYKQAVEKLIYASPSWKPSEEHLSALLAIFNDPDNIGSQTCQLALTDLYEQLKKL